MAREPFFKGVGSIYKVSFGVVTVFLYTFILFNTAQFVSSEHISFWNTTLLGYMVFLCLAIGVSDARSKLFSVSTISFIPRFALFFIPSFYIFGILFNSFEFMAGAGLFKILLTLPKWLFFVHTFVFVVIESTVQVWAMEHTKLGRVGTSMAFGFMHIFVWVGPLFLNFVLASLLFLFFFYVHWRFSKNKNDIAPLCGVHGGYNVAQMIIN
jgi:hypothetical protein